MTDAETDAAAPAATTPKERYGLEILAVLGVSLGISAIDAALSFLRTELTIRGGFANAQVTIVSQRRTTYPILDLLDTLTSILNGVLPAFLAIVLLMRSPGGPGLGIGLDRLRRSDVLYGLGFTALIGIPGLALVWIGQEMGFNATLVVVDFPDIWYRVPVLLLEAAQNGLLEEIVVTGFMLTRLRQMGWTDQRSLAVTALLRGTYHLYQGYGGFLGNLIMGVIFGWWFQRTRRVLPLVIAHFLLDAFSYLGYVYLHDRVAWI